MYNMDNVTTYQDLYTEMKKSAFPEVDDLPLMEGPFTVAMILASYLAFVLKIGPAIMKNRKPYKLKTLMLIYNAAQVAFSLYLAQRYFRNVFLEWGVAPKKCQVMDVISRIDILSGIWLYLVAKLSELLDTVFFVVRKKDSQVTFLHVYHHCLMVTGSWTSLKFWPSHTVFYLGFINSVVHAVMYTYYGLAGLGPSVAKFLFWKKYMTKFQLVQFVSMFVQYALAVTATECPPAKGFRIFVLSNTLFILLLFIHFYKQAYNKKKNV